MNSTRLIVVVLLTLTTACHTKRPSEETSRIESLPKATIGDLGILADSLAHRYIIVDGHVDLPYKLVHKMTNVTKFDPNGEFDYPRAKKGGLDAPFMSIYVPVSYQNNGAKNYAFKLINLVKGLAEKYPTNFAMAYSPQDIMNNFKRGLISFPMGMENGAPLEGDLKNVQLFHDAGIRYITLTHSKDNDIGDSSYDTKHTWGGLSPFGYKVVAEMNKAGIMIDISHVSDSTFYQVIRTTRAPVIASHSSCRHFTPGLERNMSDDMIGKLAENGGVIMVNFGSFFLNDSLRRTWNKIESDLKRDNLDLEDSLAQKRVHEIAKQKDIFGSVHLVANHIDHIVQVAGIDHVGIGSDFDGLDGVLPDSLKDVSQYPNLIQVLLKRGYSPTDISKICYKNIFRVWSQVEEVAHQAQANAATSE